MGILGNSGWTIVVAFLVILSLRLLVIMLRGGQD
jgi:hypothetical protein